MFAVPTGSDLFRVGRDEILIRQGRLSRAVVERNGTDANIMVRSSSAMGEELSGQLLDVSACVFMDSAVDIQLDRLILDRYQLPRKAAAVAIGQVQFSLPSPSPAAFTILQGTKVSTGDGRVFIVTQQVVFPYASMGPISASVRSALAGADQQAQPGAITSIVSQVPGAPPSGLTVTNALATAGAANAEADASYRNRARLFYPSLRRGTEGAIVSAALGIAGVDSASAYETLDAYGRPIRTGQLVVTDAYTDLLASLGGPTPTYAAQSSQFAKTVFASLFDVRAFGCYIDVLIAAVTLIAPVLQPSYVVGADQDLVDAQMSALTVQYVNGLAPGQPFVRNDLLRILKTISGLYYTGQEVATPNGDIYPNNILQVLRTSSSLVNVQ